MRRSSESMGLPFNQNPAHIKEDNWRVSFLLAGKVTFLNLFYINQSPASSLKLNRAWKSVQSWQTFLPAQDLKECILSKAWISWECCYCISLCVATSLPELFSISGLAMETSRFMVLKDFNLTSLGVVSDVALHVHRLIPVHLEPKPGMWSYTWFNFLLE